MKKLAMVCLALILCLMMSNALAATAATVSGAADPTVNGEYATLDAALAAVSKKDLGSVTVQLAAEKFTGETAVLTQASGTQVTVKGQKGTVLARQFKVVGNLSDSVALTVRDVVFDATGLSCGYMFGNDKKNSNVKNITLENCTFKDTAKDNDTVSIKARQGAGTLTVKNCTFSGMGSAFWGTGGSLNVTFDGVTVQDTHSGLTTGTIPSVTVKNSEFDVPSYVVNSGLDGSYGLDLNVQNNKIDSPNPVVLRNAAREGKQIEVDINGNTFAMPVAEKGNTVLFSNGASSDMVKISPADYETANEYKPAVNTGNLPKTGDDSSLMLWMALMAAGMAGFAMLRRNKVHG